MVHFRIEFDSNPCVFCPGQSVTGKILLEIPENFKARKVLVEMLGKAYTYWEGEARNNTKVKSSDIVRIRHNCADHKGKILYAKQDCIVWKCDDSKHEMPIGNYTFPFSFQLPVWCPPSFEGELGFIRYFLNVEVDRPWKFDDKFTRCFTVVPEIFLTNIDHYLTPAKKHLCKEIGILWWRKGVLKMEVRLQRQGFVCGQEVPISIRIDNATNKIFTKISVKMVQRIKYTAFRDGFIDQSTVPMMFDETKAQRKSTISTRMNAQVRLEEKKISDEIMNIRVGAQCTEEFEKSMTIPSLPPTILNCDLVDTQYLIKVKAKTSDTFQTSIKVDVPFTIASYLDNEDLKPVFKRSIFGHHATKLKNRNIEKFVPLYPVYS